MRRSLLDSLRWVILAPCLGTLRAGEPAPTFYVPENPAYTIVDSVKDSLRFTLGKTLAAGPCGHLVSRSSFVNPEGDVMGWHDECGRRGVDIGHGRRVSRPLVKS